MLLCGVSGEAWDSCRNAEPRGVEGSEPGNRCNAARRNMKLPRSINQCAMLADADLVAAIGAVAIASMGLAVMHKAYSAAFLRARTIGRARADADPGHRRRAEKRRALKRPKTLADVALPQEGSCAGAGRPEHGPLVYYSLRFLPEETASLSEEMKELQPDLLRGGESLAVF